MFQMKIDISKLKIAIICMLLLPLFSACIFEDAPTYTASSKTVLVYMVANNSLYGEVNSNINGIIEGVKNSPVGGNVLIYVDPPEKKPVLISLEKQKTGSVLRDTVRHYSAQNSVSAEVMSSVFADMVGCYAADSYTLVLWSHGYGWVPGGTTPTAPSTKWFGQDGKEYMDIPVLVNALKKAPHFDCILFDACFMAGVETAYALRNVTNYLIASPAEVISEGFPYKDIMPCLAGNTEEDYIKAASLYYDYYDKKSGYNRSASVSVLRCAEMEALAAETRKLIIAHAAELNGFDLSSVQYMESYRPHIFYDFGHFIENFTTADERQAFDRQLAKTVVYKKCTSSILSVNQWSYYIPVSHYSGLSTYIPGSETQTRNSSYHDMEWYTAAGWNNTKW